MEEFSLSLQVCFEQTPYPRKVTFWQSVPALENQFKYRSVTVSTALNLVHRNSFPKLANFTSYFTQLCNFRGRPLSKSMQIPEKKSKQSEITCKQSKPARTISKIQKRREFVRAFCCEQCPKNSFKRLYIVEGLLVLVGKTSFSKEFR